jgi:predicted nucleic acid-binding protein
MVGWPAQQNRDERYRESSPTFHRARLAPPQAATLLAEVLLTSPRLNPYIPLLSYALAISSRARIGVYDCLYVALAEREGCEFLTADDRLVRALRPSYPFITPLSSLP